MASRTKNETKLPPFSNSLSVVLLGAGKRSTVSKEQTVGAATERLAKAVARPGVTASVLFKSSSVPVFRADPKRPGVLIRLKAGKTELVRVDSRGRFTVVK